MKNKIVASIIVAFLLLCSVQVTLNFAPVVLGEPDAGRREAWQLVWVNNTLPYNTVVDVNVTVNSRNGVNIACSNSTTKYFDDLAYWQGLGYATYWDWLNGTKTPPLPHHWNESTRGSGWSVSNGSLTPISYSDIQFWGDMYLDSGGGVPYQTFMGNTYMADWNLSDPTNQPDIIYQGYWQGNRIKMINALFVPASANITLVFKIVMTETGSYTFNITTTPGVTVSPSTWTVGGVRTILVPQDYSTIQAAINAASDGDTIAVHAGTYTEEVQINKSLTIIGDGADTTYIDGNNVFPVTGPGLVTITATTGNVRFSGFTVERAKAIGAVRIGIFSQSSVAGQTFTVSDNKIYGTNNPAETDDYGFYAQGGKENIVFTRNLITQTGANNIVLELHNGSTEISYNNLEAGIGGADVIFAMTYGGVNVAALQNVSYNTFDMGTGGPLFDYAHRSTGVSFCSVYPALGSGPEANFTNMVVSGNTFNNLKSYRRAIGTWNAGTGNNLVSLLITNNTINGVLGSTESYGIDFYGLTNGATISGNTINGTAVGIYLRSGDAPGTVIHNNNIAGNAIGINWTLGTTAADARFNWWGNETGPNYAGSQYPSSPGDSVSDNVLFEPWLVKPYPPLVPITVVYVNPQFKTLVVPALGTVFTVNVTIANVTLMYGFQFTLKWNSALLTLTNPTTAHRIPTVWVTPNYISQFNYSIPGGNYSLFEAARSPAPPFNGTVTVASLTFKSILDPVYPSNVTCSLALQNVTISDPTLPVPRSILRLVYSGNYSCYSVKPKLLFGSNAYVAKVFKVPAEFDVSVNVTNIVNMNAFNFTFTYNASLLEVVPPYVTVSPFNGPPTAILGSGGGTVFVNVTGINPPVNGSMVLVTVRFRVMRGFIWNTQTRVVNCTLNFTFHEFNFGTIDHDTVNATYLYKPVPGDLDMDGNVTIIDLSAAAKYFGSSVGDPDWLPYAATFDLNCDGTINILDIVIIARNFGRDQPEP